MNGIAERRVAILSKLLGLKGDRARIMARVRMGTLDGRELSECNNRLRDINAKIALWESERELFQRRA